jgi:hypothetical protein
MRKLIYVAVFFAGMTSLGTEMLASRLLERTFGMSNLVWASVIGLILIYLALGCCQPSRAANRLLGI